MTTFQRAILVLLLIIVGELGVLIVRYEPPDGSLFAVCEEIYHVQEQVVDLIDVVTPTTDRQARFPDGCSAPEER